MNNRTCSKCQSNIADGQRFCGSCGQQHIETPPQKSTADLPPTIMSGYIPQITAPPLEAVLSPNQSQQFNQSNFQPQNQVYISPNQQSQSFQSNRIAAFSAAPAFDTSLPASPKKSSRFRFIIAGGVITLFLITVSVIAWVVVIHPQIKKRVKQQAEETAIERASGMTATSFLPSDVVVSQSETQLYKKTKTFGRSEVLQASKELPSEIQQGSENVTDAAAAEYVNATNSSQKVVLQIFKFNTPLRAVEKCEQMNRQLQSRKDIFSNVRFNGSTLENPTECNVYAEGKSGDGGLLLQSRYGVLYVSTGNKNALTAANFSVTRDLY